MPQLTIFHKQKLNANQLRTVAERRFGDARALCEMESNERANGSQYMAGFVIECLLKAELVLEYPWLESAGSANALATEEEKHIWGLCYRSHHLDEILVALPKIRERVQAYDQRNNRLGKPVLRTLLRICAEWTILARYSPLNTTHRDAANFVAEVEEIKKCLRQRG